MENIESSSNEKCDIYLKGEKKKTLNGEKVA